MVNQLSALFNAPIDLLKEHTPEYLSNLYGTVDYTYDNAGNRLTMTTDGILTQYSYDAANQLVTAGDRNFTYDGAGNVIAITSMEEQAYYKYDGANRLTGVTYDDETYAAYSYDAFGRMVSREVGEYDPENIKSFNEKAKIKNATPSSQNGNSSEKSNNGKANGNGNTNSNGNENANSNDKGNGNNDKTDIPKGLIGNENAKAYGVYKKVAEGLELPDLNVEIETFDYMGQSTNLHKVYSEHGSPMNEYYQAGGEVVAQKMFGNKGRISPAKEATLNTNGGLMYYTYDGLGTVTALHDRHGDKIEDYRYDAFGNLQTGITSPYNLQGYTGHLYDDKSSLVFMNARWYNPSVGRFMSKDTYRGDLAVPQSLNQYAYVMNNPINYVDPTGHIPVHGLSYYRGMSEDSLNSELDLMGDYWWEDYAIFEKTGHWTQQQEQAHQNADNIREALQGYVYVYKGSSESSSPWKLDDKNEYADRIEYYYTRTTTHTDIYENYYGKKYEPTYVGESKTEIESASQVAARNQMTIESDIGLANTSWNTVKIVKATPRKGEANVVENGVLKRNGVITSMDANVKEVNKSVTETSVGKGGVKSNPIFVKTVRQGITYGVPFTEENYQKRITASKVGLYGALGAGAVVGGAIAATSFTIAQAAGYAGTVAMELSAASTFPDFQFDLSSLSADMKDKRYVSASINALFLAIPGMTSGGLTSKIDDAIKNVDTSKWIDDLGKTIWPPNNGAVIGSEKMINLNKNVTLGRIGDDAGSFVAPPKTSPDKLSLAPGTDISNYKEYVVIKTIPNVEKSTVAPWLGKPGGGTQFKLPMKIIDLIREGYIAPQ